ncbi:hypothetical protein F4814DRAFT_412457 [Daldinia grandis]|nr:hypothetical protein F4814DRAFT_412457 [Daldinia grandis]
MVFGSPIGSPLAEGWHYLAASDELQRSLRAAEEQQRRATPDFESERSTVSRPNKWEAVACWPMFHNIEELERLRRSNQSDMYHMLQVLHYCDYGHNKLTKVSLRREDASVCRKIGEAARHMLVGAGKLNQTARQVRQKRGQTRWTTTLEYCCALYSLLKDTEPVELEKMKSITGSQDAGIWKPASSLVYRMLLAANISEQELLDSCKGIMWPSFWADEARHLAPLAEAAERTHRLSLARPLSPSQSPQQQPIAPRTPRPSQRRQWNRAGRVQKPRNGEAQGGGRQQGRSKESRILDGLEYGNIDACVVHGHALRNTAHRIAEREKGTLRAPP